MTLSLETLARIVACGASGRNTDIHCPRAMEELREWERLHPCLASEREPVTKDEKRASAKAEHDAAARAERDEIVAEAVAAALAAAKKGGT